jgi:predicted dehydrogenase
MGLTEAGLAGQNILLAGNGQTGSKMHKNPEKPPFLMLLHCQTAQNPLKCAPTSRTLELTRAINRMSDKLRCAVIGTGAVGLEHLHSLIACPRAAAVAVAEKNTQRARDASDRFKIPRSYLDFRELLEQPDVDAVTIAAPNHLHAEMAIEALKARKHVLVEPPLATTVKDAVRMIDTAKKMRRTLMVAQSFRFHRQTQLAKALIERGDLGEIYHVRSFWLRRNGIPRIGSWFTQKQFSGGGCACDLGVHLLDTGLHLLKEFEISSVTAQVQSKFGARGVGEIDWGRSEIDPKRPFDVEDFGVALLKLKSGKTVSMETGWAVYASTEGREYGLDLLGTNAGLSLFPARLLRNCPEGFETVHLSTGKLAYSEDRLHHFVSCVLDGKKPLVPLEESLKIQEILEAIYQSSSSGKEVRLK